MTVSRSALDLALEAYTLGESTPEQRATIADAAQALLDGEPIEWCVVHGSSRPGTDHTTCDRHITRSAQLCEFKSQIRVSL